MPKEPLYPHVPKRREPLFPHLASVPEKVAPVTPEVAEFIAAFDRSYAKAFVGLPNAPLTHHIGLRGVARELGMDFNSPVFKSRVEEMVKEGTLKFAPDREAKNNLLIRMPGLLHEQSIGLVAKSPVAKVSPVTPEVTLYRGEPIGVRTDLTDVPFTPDLEVAKGWAGKEGRVVEISLAREEFDKLRFAKLPDRIATYYVPWQLYKRATLTPVIPKAEPGMPEGKEPWQMTRKEFIKQDLERYRKDAKAIGFSFNEQLQTKLSGEQHEKTVHKALSIGKPIPPEVLKDYPDLKAKRLQPFPQTK